MTRLFLKKNKGFTLIEIMVAVSIFSFVMVVTMGSVLSVIEANRKSGSLRAVMDNVNSTMESMTRTIRFGTSYHCGADGNPATPQNCDPEENTLTVLAVNGEQVTYSLVEGRIARSIDGAEEVFITSPDVTVTKLNFWVYGAEPYDGGDDLFQPQVILVVGGYAGAKPSSQSSFVLETTISQRTFDF